MTTVIETSIGFYLPAHVSKSQWAKNNIHVFTKEKNMKPKRLTSYFEVLNKLVPGSPFTGQNLCLSNPPSKTTEHSWAKTVLGKCRKNV